MWIGFTPAMLGRHLGYQHGAAVARWALSDRVARRTAVRVRRLYDELSTRQPEPRNPYEAGHVKRQRDRARAAGWHGPDAWWDVDIDDPDAEPDTSVLPDQPGWALVELIHQYDLGESAEQASAVLGRTLASLEKIARHHHRPDVARWVGEARRIAA